jgi:hypothetical protein
MVLSNVFFVPAERPVKYKTDKLTDSGGKSPMSDYRNSTAVSVSATQQWM